MNTTVSYLRLRLAALLVTSTLALLLVSGCTVGPDYHAPDHIVKMGSWEQPTQHAATGSASPDIAGQSWWLTFGDPELSSLIERALASSPQVGIAEQRVREARAGLNYASGGAAPRLGVGAGHTEFRHTGPLSTVDHTDYSIYQTGFDASWELDIWGGTRRAVEAATAEVAATEELEHGVRVTLAAEVARTYVDLRTTQQRLGITRTNLALQQHTLELTRERLRAGVVSKLDEQRANGLVANTQAAIPLLEDGVRQLVHRLAVLLGEEPDALVAELATPRSIPTPTGSIAVGLPADLLRNRPDIRATERNLAAATASIGATKAQLYPHLSLSGTLGLVSTTDSGLFDASSRFFSFGPGAHWSIFDAGRIHAQVDAATARSEAAYLKYRAKVLDALAEVQDAIGAYTAEQQRHAALVEAADSARRSVDTATELYRQGVTDFLSVIDAERSLASAEDNLAQSDRALSTGAVALYKSLGGGWAATGPASSGPAVHQS